MKIVPVSALRDNYIWVISEENACVVVDPSEAAPVLDMLQATGHTLSAILLTHRHQDHQGGVEALVQHFQIPVVGPESTAMPRVNHPVGEGSRIDLPGFSKPVFVMATPGHTEEHIAYLWDGNLFCGDTLFACGCGRLLGGTAEQLLHSLKRLALLPESTKVFCSHEYTLSNLRFAVAADPANAALMIRQKEAASTRAIGLPTVPSSIAEEKQTNPFLRCGEKEISLSVENQCGRALADELDVFTALRAWKDKF